MLAQSVLKEEAVSKVNELCDGLDKIAMAVCSLGELSDKNKAIIISTGEYLSSTIIAYAMNAKGIRTKWVDSRTMMVTNKSYLKAEPDMDAISERAPKLISEAYEGMDAIIMQGFVGVTEEGKPTVLGRGGSDYSASLIGMAIDAERIEIWTDVDGVLTADPRKVKNTKYLEKISYEEACGHYLKYGDWLLKKVKPRMEDLIEKIDCYMCGVLECDPESKNAAEMSEAKTHCENLLRKLPNEAKALYTYGHAENLKRSLALMTHVERKLERKKAKANDKIKLHGDDSVLAEYQHYNENTTIYRGTEFAWKELSRFADARQENFMDAFEKFQNRSLLRPCCPSCSTTFRQLRSKL